MILLIPFLHYNESLSVAALFIFVLGHDVAFVNQTNVHPALRYCFSFR